MKREINFQFSALLIARVFGWTIPQVLALTVPQFEYVLCSVQRVQYWTARNEVFFGVCAALGGESDKRNLADSCGTLFMQEKAPDFTPDMLKQAEARMAEILKQNEVKNV